MAVKENGVWTQETADEFHDRCSSAALPIFISSVFKKSDLVIDFGCGKGRYISKLREMGHFCIGVEGELLHNFEHPLIIVKDLCKPLDLTINGNVISLEVGEHIPIYAEQIYLDTITSHCTDKLILSWALPDQFGTGHINCQPQEYIIGEVQKRGFTYLPLLTEQARSIIEDHCHWFRRTLLCFQRSSIKAKMIVGERASRIGAS